jgi:hypothetical protein
MARPRMEGMTYFPHDTDASNDEKIEALRALHGNDGYAFYFIICERVYRTPEAELDISHPAVLSALINKIGISRELFENILQTSFDVWCFDKSAYEDRHVLTSNGIKKRADDVKNMRERWRNNKNKENDMENPEENPEENAEETGESKVNKSKENKNKKNTYIEDFELFWSAYPKTKRQSKADALKAWGARIKQGIMPIVMVNGAKGYAIWCKKEKQQEKFIKAPATFLGPGLHFNNYLDLVEEIEEKNKSDSINQANQSALDLVNQIKQREAEARKVV